VTGLEFVGRRERIGARGQAVLPVMVFRYPAQEIADGFTPTVGERGASVVFTTANGPAGYAGVEALDRHERVLKLVWSLRSQELGTIPTVVALDDWVPPRPKPEALTALAARVLDPTGAGPPNPVSTALLRAEAPRLTARHAPPNGMFDDDPDRICEWAGHLDHSLLAIQGPPGTGKTYRGARILHDLIASGMRVGITAMSHHAVGNLLEETIKVFRTAGDLERLKAVRRGPANIGPLPRVTPATDNTRCARREFNLVAGTTWLFASNDMTGAPVEVLVVDEAGQLALADTLAASRSARNLILLGDPLQLPHVTQAQHPGGGGHSVLEHLLGAETTISPGRGVFLTETRRMHPDVCRFISQEIYEGRLTSAASCAIQQTAGGTGLRWLPAEHEGNSTECAEEADIIAGEVARLIGTTWVNQHGEEGPLRPTDILVVAPYNDQVKLLRRRLDSDERTKGVPVGTVDKFQGREAAVVFFTMTTSSADDMPRGPDFLFSRNRLNVAISRARCLAYLVCTDKLLNSRARDLDEMRLIATLCAFVEYATR